MCKAAEVCPFEGGHNANEGLGISFFWEDKALFGFKTKRQIKH